MYCHGTFTVRCLEKGRSDASVLGGTHGRNAKENLHLFMAKAKIRWSTCNWFGSVGVCSSGGDRVLGTASGKVYFKLDYGLVRDSSDNSNFGNGKAGI